jgi:hypothetical protein
VTQRSTQPWLAGALLILLILAILLALLPASASAQEENQAGLVVVFGDGRVEQRCVGFAEAAISGYELLRRSGLPLSVEAGAIGPTVCRIDAEGCGFPQEACFCRCMGSPCIYWSYWRQQPDGGWRYQALGAGNTQVRNGDVEGWHWAEGTTSSAAAPPAVSFAELCGVPASAASAGALAMTATSPVTAGEAVGATATAAAMAAGTAPPVTLTPAVAAVPDASGSAGGSTGTVGLWGLLAGVVVVPAALLFVWALVRRGR